MVSAANFNNGWYFFASSAQIKKNKLFTFNYFATSFVCFRDSTDQINIFNAYCPHLGAHLGVGGFLKDDHLTCPFHGWKFDGEGQCVAIPYSKIIPKRAHLIKYPVKEMGSLIFFYFDLNFSSLTTIHSSEQLIKFQQLNFRNILTVKLGNVHLNKFLRIVKNKFKALEEHSSIFLIEIHNFKILFATTANNSDETTVFLGYAVTNDSFLNFPLVWKLKRQFKQFLNEAKPL